MNSPADHLRAAEEALRRGRAAEAAAAARAALAAAPRDPALQHRAGMALLRAGYPKEALAPLRRAAAGPEAPLAWLIAAGNAEALAGERAAAEATFRRGLLRQPDHPVLLLNLGILLTETERLTEAEQVITASLRLRPRHAPALFALGNVRRRAGDLLGAVVAWREALALMPDQPPLLANLGGVLAELGQHAEAEATLRRALALDPTLHLARAQLGDLLLALGRLEEAEAELRRALSALPKLAVAWNSLGLVLRARGAEAEAAAAFRHALTADPSVLEAAINLALLRAWQGEGREAMEIATGAVHRAPCDARAHLALAAAAAARGDRAAAQAASHRAIALRPFVHIPATAGAAHVTVLVLQGLEGGHFAPGPAGIKLPDGHNNAIEHLDPAHFARVELFVDALADDPSLLERLPPCDVIYTAIAEPETMRRSLALAEAVIARLGLPVINPPERVLLTTRDRAPALFADIEGLVVPRVVRVPESADAAAAISQAMAEAGLDFPVILRPVGTHTGQGMRLLRSAADLATAAAVLPRGELFLTEYVEFRDPDGLWRKVRLFFIGGRILPEHYATAPDWNIHHRISRAYMAAHAAEQARECDFLDHFEKRFGLLRLAAIGEMAERLGLDYLGIDAALLPEDRLLVFEANAGMRAMFAEAQEGFAYLLPRLARLSEAFRDLVRRKAGKS